MGDAVSARDKAGQYLRMQHRRIPYPLLDFARTLPVTVVLSLLSLTLLLATFIGSGEQLAAPALIANFAWLAWTLINAGQLYYRTGGAGIVRPELSPAS